MALIVCCLLLIYKVNNKTLGGRIDITGWVYTTGLNVFTGRIGIGTSTVPSKYNLNVWAPTATTSMVLFDTASTSTGACLQFRDSDGSGYTYVTFNNGTQTATTTACGY